MHRSRPKRSGYICIWGTTNRESVTDPDGVVMQCPGCRQEVRMIGKVAKPYCSVFYIPLIPQGGGQPFIQCTRCGGKYHGDIFAIRAQERGSRARADEAIAEKMRQYRANPADADLGCEIVEMLAGSNRIDEAVNLAESLAGSHPDNANMQVLLGRLYLHKNDLSAALKYMGRAIEMNPTHAAAHYYSAVTLTHSNPPKLDEALTFAKQARDYGFPDARNLIQAIEQATRG